MRDRCFPRRGLRDFQCRFTPKISPSATATRGRAQGRRITQKAAPHVKNRGYGEKKQERFEKSPLQPVYIICLGDLGLRPISLGFYSLAWADPVILFDA